MIKTEFTPGPWANRQSSIWAADHGPVHNGMTCEECGHCPTECGPLVVAAVAPDLLSDIKRGAWDDVEYPKDADMCLIAAAPDLYDALEKCLELLDALALPEGDTVRKAEAALAKARGQ